MTGDALGFMTAPTDSLVPALQTQMRALVILS
jgi:hypothetical protein